MTTDDYIRLSGMMRTATDECIGVAIKAAKENSYDGEERLLKEINRVEEVLVKRIANLEVKLNNSTDLIKCPCGMLLNAPIHLRAWRCLMCNAQFERVGDRWTLKRGEPDALAEPGWWEDERLNPIREIVYHDPRIMWKRLPEDALPMWLALRDAIIDDYLNTPATCTKEPHERSETESTVTNIYRT
jgi:hypothetical protein